MVASVGPLATIHREPRQVRKEATVVVDSCAGVWLAEVISSFFLTFPSQAVIIRPDFLVRQNSHELSGTCA